MPWLALTGLALLGALLAYLVKIPCRFGGGWMYGGQYAYGCYTDIFPLYFRDRLGEGAIPYADMDLEYPVLIGGLMRVLAWSVQWLPDPTARGLGYFDATAVVLALCLLAAVLGTGWLAGRGGVLAPAGAVDRRRALWAGGFVALTPPAFLAAYINWDLLAVALLTGGLVAYARGHQWSAGALFGLAVAAKFYPVLVFGPLFVLLARRYLRGGGLTPEGFLRPLCGAGVAWVAVNLPVYLAAPQGWMTFFTFSQERGADWGSVYYLLYGFGIFPMSDRDLVNAVGMAAMVAACAGIAVLGVCSRRNPPLEQLVFLVVAAFVMTSKVWSPQFVLWLLPLAALAWPRTVRPWVAATSVGLWQLAEVGYFFGIWQHLMWNEAASVGLDFPGYAVVALARLATLLLLCGLVVVDVVRNGTVRDRRLLS